MPASASTGRAVPLIVACALFMENLDSSILATALPAVAVSFGVQPLRLSLAISTYLLSLAIFVPLSGWCADRFGTRLIFRLALIVFLVGSIACAAAQESWQLVAARAVQGAGGAMMVPVGRLLVLRRLRKDELVGAMAWISIPALVAPIVAPLIGGMIATYASWRWIFLINVPIGLAGLWFAHRYIHDTDPQPPRPLDLGGWFLLGIGLALLVLGFELIGKEALSAPTLLAMIAAGAAATTLYVRRARRVAHPVVDLSPLAERSFRTSMIGGNLFRLSAGSTTLLQPLLLQVGFGLSPAESGALTFVGAIGALTMRTQVQRLLRLVGFRRLLVIDAFVSSALLASCALLTAETPRLVILALFMAIGLSRSLMFTCVNTLAYADVSQGQMSHATSFAATAQQLALTVGVSIAAQLLHASATLRGAPEAAAADFVPAFLFIALLTASCALVFRRLPPDAGAAVSGHRSAITTR